MYILQDLLQEEKQIIIFAWFACTGDLVVKDLDLDWRDQIPCSNMKLIA